MDLSPFPAAMYTAEAVIAMLALVLGGEGVILVRMVTKNDLEKRFEIHNKNKHD